MKKAYFDLEFDTVLGLVAALAVAEPVKREILLTSPTTDIDEANKLLLRTSDAVNVLASHRPSLYFEDILPLLEKARVGAALSPAELLKIKGSITALKSLKNCVENMDGCDLLKDITAWVRACDDLEYAIDKAVENESELKDGASDKLFGLRRAILRANAKLKERLDGYTKQSEVSKYLQDNIVTLRGGRYVLPVRSDSRSFVKGLVHDVSATGATVFIEPFAVVDANNELITLKNEEQNEVERILGELSKRVVSYASLLAEGQSVLTECGVIFAKAEYAKKLNAYRPILNTEGRIVLNGARHPLIAADKIVPVDISLDKERILLVSGPNTGGKTVALKTVGLFAMFAASGMFLPAEEGSVIGIFDDIFCDIGDSQSIAQSLSTFSAHIKNLSAIADGMNAHSLVLLDEVGDGTDPEEGAALAVAVIKHILRARATAVVTTHFNAVKEFALGCDGISNASMQFDSVNFRPTYRLLQGVSGSSYALEIAEKLGLDEQIISDARAALSKEKIAFDKIMHEAENLRNELFEQKRHISELEAAARADAERSRRLANDYQNKLAEINENARSIIRRKAEEYAERADGIIDQIKDKLKAADETALFEARKAAKRIYDGVPSDKIEIDRSDKPATASELTVGTRVYIAGLDKNGVIASPLRGNKAVVAIGSVKTEVPVSSLSLIKETEREKHTAVEKHVKDPENIEVMLLGKTVDEAILELDRIISDIAPHSTLRIVHGKGTGALGKGIQAYLRKNNRVKSFRYGRYGEGDTGVTITEIK